MILNTKIVKELLNFSCTEKEVKQKSCCASFFGITVKDTKSGRAYIATDGRILGYVLDTGRLYDEGTPSTGITLSISPKIVRNIKSEAFVVKVLGDGTAEIDTFTVDVRYDNWERFSYLIKRTLENVTGVCERYIPVDGKYLKTIQDFLGNSVPYFNNNWSFDKAGVSPLVFYGKNKLAFLAPLRLASADKFDVEL